MNQTEEYYTPLGLNLVSRKIKYSGFYSEEMPLELYQTVLPLILEKAISAYVYQGGKEAFYLYGKWNHPINLAEIPFLIRDKGKYRFDLTKDCITGYEFFWNAWAAKRGSIVITLPKDYNFVPIFGRTYNSGLVDNPNSGNTISATKRCKQEVLNGNIAVLFPASNGCEYLYIYTDVENRDRLLSAAETICLKERS